MEPNPKGSEPANPDGMPSGVQIMSDQRRQLDDFWSSTESIRIADSSVVPSDVSSSARLLDVAQEHLATLPTGLEARERGGALHPVGKWTVRNGQMVEFEGRAGPLPEDEQLVVVTTCTTITTIASVVIDAHVVLYEIVAES